MRRFILLLLLPLLPAALWADSWEQIVGSKEYYWGTGYGTEKEATTQALAALVASIAQTVSSDFTELIDEHTQGGTITSEDRVSMSIKSTSRQTLTNTFTLKRGKEPHLEVLMYMRRSELSKIFEARQKNARRLKANAVRLLAEGKVDVALKNFYRALTLIRSLQHPSDITDDEGHVLLTWLPEQIEAILGDIEVQTGERDDEGIAITCTYQDKPVGELTFSYYNGRETDKGKVQGGNGFLVMADSDAKVDHIDIEYEYRDEARYDDLVKDVYDAVPRRAFDKARKTLQVRRGGQRAAKDKAKTNTSAEHAGGTAAIVQPLIPAKPTQLIQDNTAQALVIRQVLEAIRGHRTSDVMELFTPGGYEKFEKLIGYGRARIVGTPQPQFFNSTGGTTVVRGLQMAFYFQRGTIRSSVEDVIFTLDADNLISNVTFGLGERAENDILCSEAPGWNDRAREQIMEFMENYKTAYCLQDLDYIRQIFADDAVIIVGNVVRTAPQARKGDDMSISMGGHRKIVENRYTKDQYLEKLARCFQRNEFINLRFSRNEVRWLRKPKERDGRDIFAINLAQEYNSTSYADEGYLFLLVDMTHPDEPQIKVRTWQPGETPIEELYDEGHFVSGE